MPRRLPGDRQVLVHVWTVSLCGAAVLLVALAWLAAGDPNLAGRAHAVADAQALLQAMELRGDGWLRALRAEGSVGGAPRGEGSVAGAARSEGSEAGAARAAAVRFRLVGGRVVEPPPLLVGVPLEDPPSRQLTPAAGWLRRGLQKPADPEAALADFEQGIAAVQPAEKATAVRLRLQAALAAQRAERGEAALAHLEWLTPRPEELLDGESLWMIVGYRRSDQLELLGRAAEAEEIRESMRQTLLRGGVAVEPDALLLEAELLAPEGGASAEGGLTEAARARLLAVAQATRLDRALAAAPRAELLRTDDGVAVVDAAREVAALHPPGELEAALVAAWSELLPDGGAFALTDDAPRGAELVGVPVGPAGLETARGLWVVDFRPFVAAQTRRQGLLLAAAAAVAAALVSLAWFGRRLLLRQAELERVRSDFLAGVSHELRTPAASLVLLAENLADGRVRDEARRAEYYEALRRDAQRLQRLVGDVLDVSRIERGAFEVQLAPTAPAELLRRLAEDQRARLHDAGLELVLELPELPELPLDGGAVERALANLLENARKYAVGGSRVVVRARVEGGVLLVEVEDDGPGVPEEWRARVFERYQRAPNAETLGAGAGLGLTLVRETVQAHGGTVAVDAGSEGGARFVLRFPLEGGAAG